MLNRRHQTGVFRRQQQNSHLYAYGSDLLCFRMAKAQAKEKELTLNL
jgi:hypothetical protein